MKHKRGQKSLVSLQNALAAFFTGGTPKLGLPDGGNIDCQIDNLALLP